MAWFGLVLSQVARNRAVVSKMLADDSVPMSYYRVFRDVQKVLPKDAIIVRAAVCVCGEPAMATCGTAVDV